MELGQYQLQIFVSLVVILGAASVALICDFLKGSNEQLRELTIELKVRREEEQKRSLLMTPRPLEAPVCPPIVAAELPALAPAAKAIETQDTAEATAPAVREEVAPFRMSRVRGAARRAAAPEAIAAMERGAAMAARRANRSEVRVELPAEPVLDAVDNVMTRRAAAERVVESETVRAQPAAPRLHAAPTSEAAPNNDITVITASARPRTNWNDLLARRGTQRAPVATILEVRHAEAKNTLLDAGVETLSQAGQPQDAAVPAGFHDGYVLTRLVQSHKPVSGLVVSIGVSAAKAKGNEDAADRTIPAEVRELIQSLMEPEDFACASAPDEYLLIFPQERGASAQRRLSAISQKLWDFQLQKLGDASILFSWGALEVRGESIDEAIASASERMQETRRGRMGKSGDTRGLKIAV